MKKEVESYQERYALKFSTFAYVGQTRSRKLITRLKSYGWGESTNRGELPNRRNPWFLDNGAFRDWKAGESFNHEAFARDLAKLRECHTAPDFIVAPDMVGCGIESLKFSLEWKWRLKKYGVPIYLCVQDGLTREDLDSSIETWGGVFVGGTLGWKMRTAPAWIAYAHLNGLKCHVGRVGTAKRVRWAREIKADSIDSCVPLWSETQLVNFHQALTGTIHTPLPTFREHVASAALARPPQ